MAKHRTLSKPAQAAAAREELKQPGMTLDKLRKEHPELIEGIKVVEAEQQTTPVRRGSGSTRPVPFTLEVPSR